MYMSLKRVIEGHMYMSLKRVIEEHIPPIEYKDLLGNYIHRLEGRGSQSLAVHREDLSLDPN